MGQSLLPAPHPSHLSRSSKRYDIAPASRWATLSFYENSPKVVEQHLSALTKLEVDRVAALLADREALAERNRKVRKGGVCLQARCTSSH